MIQISIDFCNYQLPPKLSLCSVRGFVNATSRSPWEGAEINQLNAGEKLFLFCHSKRLFIYNVV